MKALLWHPATLVWLGLVFATGLSWHMGTGVGADADVRLLSTMLIAVALLKVRFVIRYFMEVRGAAVVLKRLTDAWAIGVFVVLLVLYWQAT